MNDSIKTFIQKYYAYLILIVSAAAAFMYIMPPLNADILNYDSAYQYFLTCHNINDIAVLLTEDYSPPLYTLLLKGWTLIFGETLASMRVFALIVIWGLLFIAAFPVKAAFGKRASAVCMFLYAFSSLNFILIPEIRPTVLACFFTAAAAVYSYLALFYGYRYSYVCMTVF